MSISLRKQTSPLGIWTRFQHQGQSRTLNKSRCLQSLAGYSPWGHKRVGHDLETKQQLPSKGFPSGAVVKNLPANAGDARVVGLPGRYSPWDRKELNMTQHACTHAAIKNQRHPTAQTYCEETKLRMCY